MQQLFNAGTSPQSTIMWVDQTPSTGQDWRPIIREDRAISSSSFLNIIYYLSDSTGDGGVLLNSRTPFSFPWGICIQIAYTSKISRRVLISNGVIYGAADHSWSLIQTTSALSPHLVAIQWIKEVTGLPWQRIGNLLGVSRQTIDRWEKGEAINDPHRRRLFAVREVLKRALSQHPQKEQLVAWLDTPRGVDGRTPAQLLEANEINRARLLAISSPSPGLVRPPAWVNRSIPKAYLVGAERRQEALPPETDSELTKLVESGEYGIDENGEGFPITHE